MIEKGCFAPPSIACLSPLIRFFRALGFPVVPQFSLLQRFGDLQDDREIFLPQLGCMRFKFVLQLVDLRDDREIFLTQLGRMRLEIMLQQKYAASDNRATLSEDSINSGTACEAR
jgi:hypothetical protein